MDKSPISQLFCFHDTKHYWFYFFREYLELISYCGIVEMHHRVNKEDSTQAPGGAWAVGGELRPPGDQAPEPMASLARGHWWPSKPSPEDPSLLVRGRYLRLRSVDPWVLLPTRSTNRPANGNIFSTLQHALSSATTGITISALFIRSIRKPRVGNCIF